MVLRKHALERLSRMRITGDHRDDVLASCGHQLWIERRRIAAIGNL
jgi:hypothetical protein